MDTSKQYIEMCMAAKEIQNKAFQGYGLDDYLCFPSSGIVTQVFRADETCTQKGNRVFITTIMNIWLPRQDQLQELMLSNDQYTRYINKDDSLMISKIDPLFGMFIGWYYDYEKGTRINKDGTHLEAYYKRYLTINSFEEAWLKYYMNFIHCKIWCETSKSWVKI